MTKEGHMSHIFICADIEGTASITSIAEIHKNETLYYPRYAELMTREVAAACRGAVAGGATDICVKDSHGGADNIDPLGLPENVRLIRGWGTHPHHMMFGIHEGYNGVFLTGCHSSAGTNGSPLAHSFNGNNNWVKLNGEIVCEAYINCLTAASLGVPTLLITGDDAVCRYMRQKLPNIEYISAVKYEGCASISQHPNMVARQIEEAAQRALSLPSESGMPKMPSHFDTEIYFKNHAQARGGAFYPGAVQTGTHTVAFSADNWFDVLCFYFFVLEGNLP